MKLNILLEEAINNIEVLKQYYNSQIYELINNVKVQGERYKYSIVLEKYLFIKATEAQGIQLPEEMTVLSEKEQSLLDEVLDSFDISEKEDSIAVSYKLKDVNKLENKYELIPDKGVKEYNNILEQPKILGNTTLMMLLIKFEQAIVGIFKYLLEKYPKAYLSNKTVTYSELVEIDLNINEVKEYFIENEVDLIMHLPISDWYRMFQTKHKAMFDFEDNEFEIFKEIYYRRNILVHNNAKVNKVYIENVDETIIKGTKLGAILNSDPDYIKKALDITQIILYATFWGLRKVTEDKEALENKLFDIAFMHMMEEKWIISKFVYNCLVKEEGQSDSVMLVNMINYWISMKNNGEFDLIKEDVERFDVSAKSGQFKVAKYALLNDYSKVTEYLELVIGREILASSVETWPLFLQFRTSEEYLIFKDKHKDLFEIHEYDPDVIENENCEEIDEGMVNNLKNI